MGFRILIKNKIGHRFHKFDQHSRKLSEPENTPVQYSCWCGEVVEEA